MSSTPLIPRIHVKIVSVAGSYQKVRIAFASGSTPDVCSAIWADELAGYAMRRVLEPLDGYMKASHRSGSEWAPGVWRMLNYKGCPYALSTTTNSQFLAQQQNDLSQMRGLDPEKPPTTIAELDRDAERTTAYDSEGNFIRYGFRPGGLVWWAYVFGGKWYDEKTGRITANDPKNIDALRWMVSYTKKYDINKMEAFQQTFGSMSTVSGPFFVGKQVMWVTGEWAQEFIRRYAPKPAGDTSPPLCPPGGRPDTTSVGGSVFAIPVGSRHKQAAWEVPNWICGPKASKEFCLKIGNFSSLKSVSAAPGFRDFPCTGSAHA